MRDTYEYTTRKIEWSFVDDTERIFNTLALNGWRVHSITGQWALFERVIDSATAPQDRSHDAHPVGRDQGRTQVREGGGERVVSPVRAVDPPSPPRYRGSIVCPNCESPMYSYQYSATHFSYRCASCGYEEDR